MSLGNGNPKEGDKGSNFNYELKVLQGLESIAVALENQPTSTNYGLYAATANSGTITNTTIPGSLIGAGVGTLTVPADGFKVGDSFHLNMMGHISCVNNAQLAIVLNSGSTILGTTGFITLAAATNKHWELNVDFTIRALGPAGTASIAVGGIFTYSKNSANIFEGTNFIDVNTTTFQTTAINTLSINAQWFAANAGNSVYSQVCTLNKIY
jgi:hypothetical protein